MTGIPSYMPAVLSAASSLPFETLQPESSLMLDGLLMATLVPAYPHRGSLPCYTTVRASSGTSNSAWPTSRLTVLSPSLSRIASFAHYATTGFDCARTPPTAQRLGTSIARTAWRKAHSMLKPLPFFVPPSATSHLPQTSPRRSSRSQVLHRITVRIQRHRWVTRSRRQLAAEARATALRADRCTRIVEPNRVLCALCSKWVQLRFDSSYCPLPWLNHRTRCLRRLRETASQLSGRDRASVWEYGCSMASWSPPASPTLGSSAVAPNWAAVTP